MQQEGLRTYIVAKGKAENDITDTRRHISAAPGSQLYASRKRAVPRMSCCI